MKNKRNWFGTFIVLVVISILGLFVSGEFAKGIGVFADSVKTLFYNVLMIIVAVGFTFGGSYLLFRIIDKIVMPKGHLQ